MKLFTRRFYNNFRHIQNDYIGKPINFMEIGVFQGWTAEWIIKNILTHPDSHYVGIDPWIWFKPFHKRFSTEEKWKTDVLDRIEMLKEKYNGKAEFIRGFSHEILCERKFPKQSIDVIYIDGHHTIISVLRDFVFAWPLLKINGVMIFDDYLQGTSDQVHIAVDTIITGLSNNVRCVRKRPSKIEILFKNYQVGMKKLGE